MAKKIQVKKLGYDDIGKQVIYSELNGDRSSGTLLNFMFSQSDRVQMAIGNSNVSVHIDDSLEVTD